MRALGEQGRSNGGAVELYAAAERYVNGLIVGPPSPAPGTPLEVVRARQVARLDRLKAFLAFIGDPQRRYRTLHVAGTSGKGSTSMMLAAILSAAGFRTGCHVSPYLQVATEKLMIDGRIVPAERYARLVDDMRGRVAAWEAAGNERVNYGEFWVAMTLQYFAEERVDVAVIEVGAGGRFDVTNVIEPEVAVVTSVGYDHMATLGPTLPEIAWHKAGIIKRGSVAVTAVAEPVALPVVEAEARALDVPLRIVRAGADFRDVETSSAGTTFIDGESGRRFTVPLAGTFQATNAALALAAARAFERDAVTLDAVDRGLRQTRFPGRIEIVERVPLVVLDGAHNPEKVGSLVRDLDQLFPGRRLALVFGVLESKSHAEMLALLAPRAEALVATAPRVLAKPPIAAEAIAALAPPGLAVTVEPDAARAVDRALEMVAPDDLVLVTGSLYLVGNVRERWYATAAILEQGTCWPVEMAPTPEEGGVRRVNSVSAELP